MKLKKIVKKAHKRAARKSEMRNFAGILADELIKQGKGHYVQEPKMPGEAAVLGLLPTSGFTHTILRIQEKWLRPSTYEAAGLCKYDDIVAAEIDDIVAVLGGMG